jgi:hypothetical protein
LCPINFNELIKNRTNKLRILFYFKQSKQATKQTPKQ